MLLAEPLLDRKRLEGGCELLGRARLGITVEPNRPLGRVNSKRRGACSFAGGVSDGKCGVPAMDFER